MYKTQKNSSLELLRFLFTSIIIFFHINLDLWDQQKVVAVFLGKPVTFFMHGNIAVEFFFLVTGLLMAKSVYRRTIEEGEKRRPAKRGISACHDLLQETLQFTGHKARTILPCYLTACALTPLMRLATDRALTLEYFLLRMPSLLFLQRTGLGKPFIGCTWYLSSMFLALLIAYPLCRRFYRAYTRFAGPLLGCFLLWAIISQTGSLGDIDDWFYITYKTNVRAFAEISLGAFSFECSRFLQGRVHAVWCRILLTVTAAGAIILSIAYMCSAMSGIYALPVVGLLFLAVTIIFSGEGALSHFGCFRHPVFAMLGAVSLPMYVSQTLFRRMIPYWFPKSTQGTQCAMIYLSIVLFALILHAAITWIGRRKKSSRRIRQSKMRIALQLFPYGKYISL